jgi:broad specificity phosphatase PhoE/predicted O-methyltransferase YrrM
LEQTAALAVRLSTLNLSAVYSSPADRAVFAAQQIAQLRGLPVDIIPQFAEWHTGEWDGLTRNEVQERHSDHYRAWLVDPASRRPPGGESFYDVAARSIPTFLELAELATHDGVAIVGHNTLNRVILAHILCVPLPIVRDSIVQRTGCINTIVQRGHYRWQVMTMNELSPTVTVSESASTSFSLVHFLTEIERVHAELSVTWPEGRNPCIATDGQHWTLPPFDRPVSVGRVEARFLANIATLLAPQATIEIGTGFGYSTLWLAAGALAADHHAIVYSVDNLSEGGLGHTGLQFVRRAARLTGVGKAIRLVHGDSPNVLAEIPIKNFMLAFIDGNHRGDQPHRDFEAIAKRMNPEGIVVWHDVDSRYTVPSAWERSLAEGWQGKIFDTSCRIGVTFRSDSARRAIDRAFDAASHLTLIGQHA